MDNYSIIKKNLDFIRNVEKEILEEILENDKKYDQLFSSGWYDKATKRMVKLIKNGGYPVDVINELAREFSEKVDGSYESFSFARDALDRRAWELGLRYTNNDNTMYTDIKHHNGKINDKITEVSENRTKILERTFPSVFERIKDSYKFWKLKETISSEIVADINKKNYIKIKNKKFSLSDIFKYLFEQKNTAIEFLDDVTEKITEKYPNLGKNTPITSKYLYRDIIEIIVDSMLFVSGLVSKPEDVFKAVSEKNYLKGEIYGKVDFDSDENLKELEKTDIKDEILNKIKNNQPLNDEEKKFLLKNLL